MLSSMARRSSGVRRRYSSLSRASRAFSIFPAASRASSPFSSSERILYGLIFVLIYSVTLEKVMLFGTGKVQISIYSRAYEEINRMIVTNMDRGSTLYKVRGGYSGEDSWVVETVVPKRSLFPLREKILAIDPKAFVVVNPISEVNGRGFTLNKNA